MHRFEGDRQSPHPSKPVATLVAKSKAAMAAADQQVAERVRIEVRRMALEQKEKRAKDGGKSAATKQKEVRKRLKKEARKKVFVNVPLTFERPIGCAFPKNDLLSKHFVIG